MNHYDLIIIGSGAGGGTLALKLAASGKGILIIERGDYLPREKANWDPTEVLITATSPMMLGEMATSIERK